MCDPDFNAWTNLKNEPPSTSTNLRSCGGHIHIGYDSPNRFVNRMIIKALDIFVGVPFIIIEPDNDRKALYGKAGAFRDKSYGCEYRTPSNFYANNEEITLWLFENIKKAIEFVNIGNVSLLTEMDKENIINCINRNDKELAFEIINNFNVNLPEYVKKYEIAI